MKYKEQKELVSDLRMLADFYERPESIVLPMMSVSEWQTVTQWDWDNEAGRYSTNLEKSKDKLKQIVKALGSCEKNFTDNRLEVRKEFGHNIRLNYNVTREAYCKRVPTGETKVIPASKERVEPVYDWVCEDTSILK